MIVSYDRFTEAFLAKVTEYDFFKLTEEDRTTVVDGYMKRACAEFSEICLFDIANGDDDERTFDLVDATENDVEEIVNIVSDGMVTQWLRQHLYKQENLSIALNTADFQHYSPAELTYRITNAYKLTRQNLKDDMREYSFRHGDLTRCHI